VGGVVNGAVEGFGVFSLVEVRTLTGSEGITAGHVLLGKTRSLPMKIARRKAAMLVDGFESPLEPSRQRSQVSDRAKEEPWHQT
jgi:hypothetical protein